MYQTHLSLVLPLLNLLCHVQPSQAAGTSVPIYRPSRNVRLAKRGEGTDFDLWMKGLRAGVGAKYGKGTSTSKRMKRRGDTEGKRDIKKRGGKGADYLYNQGDTVYFGQVSLGTPQQTFFVVLDTGSSDLWLASSTCTVTGCQGVSLFDSNSSSTFTAIDKSFRIQYGSGAAQGTLGRETITLGDQTVDRQVFAIATNVEDGTLNSPLSGLLGLGFQSIAASKATPLVQALADQGALDDPVVAFAFTRFNDNSGGSSGTEPGGLMTIGGTDSTLYQGTIEEYDLADDGSYWLLPLTGVSVDGQSISFATENAAIDTGTSLIAGPPEDVASIYAAISGSAPYSGAEGYYTIPCSFNSTIALKFGTSETVWNIDPDDFVVGQVSTRRCVGGLFAIEQSSGTPDWIVGDVFLKNVYSVYNYEAKTVGFAQLNSANVEALESDTASLKELTDPTANGGTGGATLDGGSTSTVSSTDSDSSVGSSSSSSSGGTTGSGSSTSSPAVRMKGVGVEAIMAIILCSVAFGMST